MGGLPQPPTVTLAAASGLDVNHGMAVPAMLLKVVSCLYAIRATDCATANGCKPQGERWGVAQGLDAAIQRAESWCRLNSAEAAQFGPLLKSLAQTGPAALGKIEGIPFDPDLVCRFGYDASRFCRAAFRLGRASGSSSS
jgi:hypothetical protein